MKKYFWQIIGVLLTITAIFAAYNIFCLGRPVKALQIIIDTASQLVNIRPEATGTIQIVYNGQVVSNPQLLQIKIKNSGNQPIIVSDYSTPLLFSFDPQDEIIDVSVVNSQPSNIGMTINKTAMYQATAIPTLLNPYDVVTVRFIVAQSGNDSILNHFHVDGRIIGVNEVSLVLPSDQQTSTNISKFFQYVALAFSLVSLLLMLIFNSRILKFFKRDS